MCKLSQTVVSWLKKLFFFSDFDHFFEILAIFFEKCQFFENFEFLVWLGPPPEGGVKKIFLEFFFFLENLLLELPELTEIGMLNTR